MGRARTALGVDLAGVPTRPTGICILRGYYATTRLVFTDEEILAAADRILPAVISIDAPLCLPLGRRSIHDRSGPHLRACERELLRRRIRFFPITIGPMRLLASRGIALKERLARRGHLVIEVYPGGAQDLLGIPRKSRGLEALREGHERMGIRGLGPGLSDHELDAVTAALVGRLFLAGDCEIYGTPGEGTLVMPRGSHRRA